MLTVNSIDIQNWAKTIKSRSDLPDLIRRLIYNTIAYKDIEYVAFPCGENIDNPGYDGELIVKESNPFIPLGRSVWEMSTQKNISQKANEDLKKRSEGKDEKKKDTVFIFVTVNIWNRKKGWVAEKSAHGVWKEVRAYDALDIEEWLINSHSAKRWFLEQIGKSAPDLITLESYAKQWISSFELEIPVQISLAGRKSDIEQVHNFLNNTDKTLRIRSITKDEVIIFLYSAIQALPDDQRKNAFLSNAIVAKTSDSLRSQNLDSISELLIIPAFTNIQDINYQSGQKFMIPLDPSTPSKKEDLELSRITIREIENQLVSVGFSDNEAKLWSKNSGGTLTILRRLISGPHLPEWAYKNQNQIRQILPIMFVQSWKTEYSGDKEMISKLAKTEYSDYNSFLTEILHYSDRPIHRIGNMWFTYSVLDCYLSFMSYTTKDDWNLFRDVVIEVLSERNPELDLESQNRVFSAIYGKNRKYSEELRKGLAQSLILLAIYGKHSGNDSLHDHAGYVDQIVENIFLIADKDLWYSLGDVMPLLAEASPTKFIRAVEASLSSKEKYIMNMFDEAQVTLFSKDIHYNLLWALQALAWDKRFFKRVVMALCQLSELEPGKDAFNNLTSIFCLWIPQTETSMDERFDVLADIQKTYPAIGWKLLMTLLPSSNDFGTYTSRYKWRELSCPPRPDISQIQFEESIYKTIELAYSYHDNSALSWVQIFDHYDNLPVSCKRMIAEQFKTKVSELIDPEHIVAEKLRSIISKHRTYKSAKWALPEAEIKYLEDLYKQVEPDSALAKYKYLFADFFPDLLEGRKNYQENPKYINQLRTETLKEKIGR
ncbi:MAG: hypothetical protein PHC50_10220, partial [Candidatus Cloacimonetes bacterium]|nr:hypothetical protein [Candidatus Cloacimonadota bacterium]